ncbi:MAG: phosphatase PAP2 family protein [Acidimicrobiia bacterium]
MLIILGLSVIYNLVRSGSEGSTALALEHAREIMRWQRMVGLNFEESLQDWALHFEPLVIALNYVYGSLHFLVTGGVIIFLFQRHPGHYRRWRNALVVATFLGLVGFVTWPLMPPRLLPDNYGFVDTLARYPTLWSFESGALNKISNQYAAMPSLHFAWALFCTCALLPVVRHPVARLAATAYLPLTLAAIVLTGNHFFLDAAGGAGVLGIGYLVARRFTPGDRTAGGVPASALT